MKSQSKIKDKLKTAPRVRSLMHGSTVAETCLFDQGKVIRNIISPPLQTKIAIGQAGDQYEREADAVADEVVASEHAPLISRISTNGTSDNSAQRQVDTEDEEEQTQTKDKQKEDEEEKLQTKLIQRETKKIKEEEGLAQTKLHQRKNEEDEEKVQTKSTPNTSSSGSKTAAASHTINNKGSGSPINPATRQTIESSIGADISSVRIHDDSSAKNAAKELNARAFTYKNDIWLGEGESQSDTRLMAHEATHVVQQTGMVQGYIQRQETTATASTTGGNTGDTDQEAESTVDASTLPYEIGRLEGDVITFDKIEVPAFKLEAHRGSLYNGRRLRQKKGYVRKTSEGKDPAQRANWKEQINVNNEQIVVKLEEKAKQGLGISSVNRSDAFVYKGVTKDGADRFFVGSLPTIANELTLPSWNKEGRNTNYDVDHIVELQLANWNDDPWGNTLPNMELLESGINSSSGSTIKSKIDNKVEGFISATNGQYGNSKAAVKRDHHLEFQTAESAGGGSITDNDYWVKNDIQQGRQVDSVTLGSMADLGGEGRVMVYPDITGGQPKGFVWPGEGITGIEKNWIEPFEITSKQFNIAEGSENSKQFGLLTFRVPENHPELEQFSDGDQRLPIKRIPGARYAGYVDKSALRRTLTNRLKSTRTSPIEIASFDIYPEGGIYVSGQILPDTPLFEGSGINFELIGNNLTFYKQFQIGDFQVPSPFEITESSLMVSLSTETGLGIEGRADFGIQGVGEGYLGAGANTSGGLNLEGGFSFDTALFDPAEVSMKYEGDIFSVEGQLGINEGKVRGIRSAEIGVGYSAGQLGVTGTAQLAVPGVQEGNLSLTYSESEGIAIGGGFQLSNDIPGIESGSVEATISKSPEEEVWSLTASGTARPSIPGVDTTINVSYDNGAITAEGTAQYSRGMLAGSLRVGATNREVDAEGNPTGEPGERLIVYGGGSVTVQIAPWLQGTIGVRLLPNGEVELTGEIGLPDILEIFPEKSLDKNIFNINLDIPIIGFAVAGQRIGIFATIGGGLDLSAGVGPGQLQELGLAITYNPDHEDQTHVTGGANLAIPAHAGLRLFIRGALGAGIPIVSAQLGLEVGGQLGLEGAAEAGVEVDWTPAQGLVLDALGEIYVEPKFRFDLTGFALVEADLLLTSIELYSKRWELAAFELGPNLRFGVRLPIHYEENQPFELSWDNVEFDVPEVETSELLGDLVKQIV